MEILDTLTAYVIGVASKATETFTAEAIKRYISSHKADVAQKNLFSLYEQLSLLDLASEKFVNALEDFVRMQIKRRQSDSSAPRNDLLWDARWTMHLVYLLADVQMQMTNTTKILEGLSPQGEIYLPEIKTTVVSFENLFEGESRLLYEMSQLSAEAIGREAKTYRYSLTRLTQSKQALAEFIRAQYKFSETF